MKSLPNSPWQGLSLPSRKSCSERVVLDHRHKGGDGEVGGGASAFNALVQALQRPDQ